MKLRKSLADGTWGKPDPMPEGGGGGEGGRGTGRVGRMLSSSSSEVPLTRANWGMPKTIPEPEALCPLANPLSPPSSSVLSPTPTITSTLSSLHSDVSSLISASLSSSSSSRPAPLHGGAVRSPAFGAPLDHHHPISHTPHNGPGMEVVQMNSDQHTISYYTGQAVPSPASSQPSPYAPPTVDSSPAHSLFQGAVGSPASGVSSPASSLNVGVVVSDGGRASFSLTPASDAVSSMFGNTSTDFIHSFSSVPPYQGSIPNHQGSIPDRRCQVPPFQHQSMAGHDSIPSPPDQNQNGDELLERLLTEASSEIDCNSVASGPGEIRYYNADVTTGGMVTPPPNSHHVMSGDVTVATTSAGQFVGVGAEAGNQDIMEILSQFS